jgi:hypothetical protein
MLPLGVTIPATVPQRSDIPEVLVNYPVYVLLLWAFVAFSGINFTFTVIFNNDNKLSLQFRDLTNKKM